MFSLRVLFDFVDSLAQNQAHRSRLIFRNDLGRNRDMVYFMLCHQLKLISKLANNLRRGFDYNNNLSRHPHGDLNKQKCTGPISLS